MATSLAETPSITGTALIGAVIVARMKSSRLPGKSMVEIAGRPSLEWMVRRLSAARTIKKFVFATTTDPADQPIADLAARLGHACYRGSEDDVLGRVCAAARSAALDLIVHVTGDCPLVDAAVADAMVELYLNAAADYASLPRDAYPPGMDVEVFSTETLAEVEATFRDPWVREHVTVPFYTMPERFRAVTLPVPPDLRKPEYRICIDTEQDYAVVKEIFAHLLPQGEQFTTREIVRLLDRRPDLAALTASVKGTKYACGVIGLGAIGALYEREPMARERTQTHARAYLRYGKTQLAAVCDTDARRREAFIADWSVERAYATTGEMFAAEDLAIVSVATPVGSHAEICLQAVESGVKTILCEKPFVLDPDDGRRVIAACRDRGILLAVNHWRRWSKRYIALRNFIQAGGLGRIQCVRGHYTKGALNNGSHMVDLLRFLFGEVHAVRATGSFASDTTRSDADLAGILRMDGEMDAHLTFSDHRAYSCFELDVMGTEGRLNVSDDHVAFWKPEANPQLAGARRLRSAEAPFPIDLGDPFVAAVAELVAYLDDGKGTPSCTGEDGLRAVETILALRRSWDAGGKYVGRV